MRSWQKVGRNLLIWLAYASLTVLVTWPLAGRLGTHIPGSEGDAWVHQWTFRWVRDQLASGGDIFFTEMMYHPQGVSLLQHNFAWFHIALWLPLQALFDEGTAYSLIFLFGFSLTAYTTYKLAYEFVQHETAAFAAGLVAGFWPYTLSHHNHPNLIFIGFVPLAVLYTKRVWERPDWRNGLGLMISVALVGIVRWQLLALCLALLVIYWLYCAWRSWRKEIPFSGRSVIVTAVALVLAAVIMFPLAYPLIEHQFRDQVTAEDLSADESRIGETDLLAYLTPSRYHPLWGEQAFAATENFIVNKIFTPYLGVTVLILAGFALRYRWRDSWIWLLIALVYILLALGATLTINGRDYINLPYIFLEDTFFGALIRRPDRFNVLLSIPMAMLTAYGMMEIVYMPRLFARKEVIWVLLCGFIIFESLTVYPTYALTTPSWYSELAQEEGDFAIVELPRHSRVYDEQYMYYQFVHGKRLVGGHVSRPPAEMLSYINSVPLLRDSGFGYEPADDIENIGRQLTLLAEADVRYLVLHKQFMSEEQQNAWRDKLVMDPVHEDGFLIVYNTAERPPIAEYFTPELGLVKADVDTSVVTQGGWIKIDVAWASEGNIERDYKACMVLRNPSDMVSMRQCRDINWDHLPTTWATNELIHDVYDLNIDPYLVGKGEYRLELTLNGDVSKHILVDTLDIAVQPRNFIAPKPMVDQTIYWDGPIQLIGYDVDGDQLTLHWHSTARIPERYVVFRHIIDTQTGELVAQADSAPQNWGYPTSWWEAAEYVSDPVTLPLFELPANTYEVRVGLYDEQTGERLDVFGPDQELSPDAAVPLFTFRR